jgi:hypothetical protein
MFAGALYLWLGAACLVSQNTAPPLSDPRLHDGELQWFTLAETPEEIAKALGAPRLNAPFAEAEFVSWQYQIGLEDQHEFSHQLVFRKNGQLVSVTRNYETERTVDEWFPAGETTAHFYPNAEKPEFSVRVRRLPGGRLLMAMGISKPGQTTGQIMLMRDSELRYFYPWLAKQVERRR